LPNKIQNKFIGLLHSEVRDDVISKIMTRKYFSLLFACTLDDAHEEKMSQAVGYDMPVLPTERFL
jgi:hypothetical protein